MHLDRCHPAECATLPNQVGLVVEPGVGREPCPLGAVLSIRRGHGANDSLSAGVCLKRHARGLPHHPPQVAHRYSHVSRDPLDRNAAAGSPNQIEGTSRHLRVFHSGAAELASHCGLEQASRFGTGPGPYQVVEQRGPEVGKNRGKVVLGIVVVAWHQAEDRLDPLQLEPQSSDLAAGLETHQVRASLGADKGQTRRNRAPGRLAAAPEGETDGWVGEDPMRNFPCGPKRPGCFRDQRQVRRRLVFAIATQVMARRNGDPPESHRSFMVGFGHYERGCVSDSVGCS